MASKASISRISEAAKEKIRNLYVRHGVPKHALARRFHIPPGDVSRITKGLKSVEASQEVQALGPLEVQLSFDDELVSRG